MAHGIARARAGVLAVRAHDSGLEALWDAQRLAIVLGVSYPQPTYSHFSSMAIWQSASPVEQNSNGWIGRWLDGLPHDAFRAIGIDSTLTPLLTGVHRAGSMPPMSGLQVAYGQLGTDALLMLNTSTRDSQLTAEAAGAIADLFQVSATVGLVLKNGSSVRSTANNPR